MTLKKFKKIYEGNDFFINSEDWDSFKEFLKINSGWVYIAKSDANNLLKIGKTSKNPIHRAKTLSPTGVLHDFEIVFALKVWNRHWVESNVHKKIKKHLIAKEFFSISLDSAIENIIKVVEEENIVLNKYIDLNIIKEDLELFIYAIKK